MSVSNPTPSVVSASETTPSPAISRTNLILLVILLAQLAVTVYLFWPSQTSTNQGTPLLDNVAVDLVTNLTITDNNGVSVNFVKEGDTWTLTGSEGYPAKADKITQILTKLSSVSSERLVTQTSSSHDRLQVAEGNYLRKVDITTDTGTQTLYFGSSTGAAATHVREANDPATYLTNEIATWELDTLNTTWIDVAYFKVPKEQIEEVTLENANGTYTFVRGEGENAEWTLADATPEEPVAPANINTLLDRIANLNLHTVLGKTEKPEYGLEAPLATLTVTSSGATTETASAESKTTTLLLGAKDDETNTYYLKSSDSEFYVRLAAFTGDELVNKQRSDFMIQSTEAAPESTTPEVDASGLATGTDTLTETTSISSQSVATDTVDASEVTTDTSQINGQSSTTSTVEASETTTETTEADTEATQEVTVESSDVTTGTEEAEAEATPDN